MSNSCQPLRFVWTSQFYQEKYMKMFSAIYVFPRDTRPVWRLEIFSSPVSTLVEVLFPELAGICSKIKFINKMSTLQTKPDSSVFTDACTFLHFWVPILIIQPTLTWNKRLLGRSTTLPLKVTWMQGAARLTLLYALSQYRLLGWVSCDQSVT